ncbi:ABC transporter ATP-binding protein [Lacunimicrobium album]
MTRLQQTSSRRRFIDYQQKLTEKLKKKPDPKEQDTGEAKDLRKRVRTRSAWELIKAYLGIIAPFKWAVVVALAAVTVSTLIKLIPPAGTKIIVDYVLGEKSLEGVWPASLPMPSDRWHLLIWVTTGMLVISLLDILLALTGRWFATWTSLRVRLGIRKEAFEQAIRLPLSRVQDLRSGGVASLLREDGGSVGELLFTMLYNPWRAVVQLMGSVVILAWVDYRLLIGATVMVPAVYLTHRTWDHHIRPRYKDIRKRREEIDAQSTESFGGMRVLRAFHRERSESYRFVNSNNLLGRQEVSIWWWARILEGIWELLIPAATCGLMLYGGWQVLQGTLTIGDLMMFLVYVLMLLQPLAVLAESAGNFQNSLSALDRVLDLLQEPREFEEAGTRSSALKGVSRARESTGALPSSALSGTFSRGEKGAKLSPALTQGALSFEGVSFRYSDQHPWAIREIDLAIPAGSSVALVGHSGAGKTTLCNLVARFYDPTLGAVKLGGVDLREIDLDDYRSLLGVVEQDVFLFDGTIAENIAYARRNVSLDEIRVAAKAAYADEFILSLPNGYDTVIGERGVKLSGGQRQRLAIARAVLADPRILILDEATSNLDTMSEQYIQASLKELLKGRTSFIIAHRLSTIRHADLIVVLEHGRILETGTHEELISQGGKYLDMIQRQTATSELAEADVDG